MERNRRLRLELLFALLRRRRNIFALLLLGNSEETSRRRRWRVHPVNRRRHEFGEFRTVEGDLRLDEQRFRNYLRLSPTQFDELAKKVEPYLQKEVMWRNDVISPKERLAVTLRYGSLGVIYILHHHLWGKGAGVGGGGGPRHPCMA